MGTDALDSTPFQARNRLAPAMGKHLLIFSYWFPPANTIGSSRPVAMARFFAARGWRVTVIAGIPETVPHSFQADLTGFDVHYVPDGWLTRRASFRAERGVIAQRATTALRLLAWPDHIATVARAMRRRAMRLLRDIPAPDVVLSTALPFSVHGAARAVAQASGALLVADNRDIWADNSYQWRLSFYKSFERRHEARTLAAADLVVAVSEGMSDHYRTAYPALADRVLTVTNGFDPGVDAAIPYRRDPGRLRLVYTGIFYGDRRDVTPLLRAAQGLSVPVSVDFYGSETDVVRRLASEFPGLAITDHGKVSRGAALRAQADADALVLVGGPDRWGNMMLPGKLFEYAGAGRPIVALTGEDSDSGRIIARHGLGLVSTDEGEIAAFLARLAAEGTESRTAVPRELTRDYQLGLLEARLTDMLAR